METFYFYSECMSEPILHGFYLSKESVYCYHLYVKTQHIIIQQEVGAEGSVYNVV